MDRRIRYRLTCAALFLLAPIVAAHAQFAPEGGQAFPGGPGVEAPPGLNVFGGPETPFPPMFQMPQLPEMAKKTQAIMVLRALLEMRFTAKDISAALPALKTMRDAEKTLESKSNQILDDEKRSLLSADPNSPAPPEAGEKMGQVMEAYRQQTERAWDSLSGAIGREKAGGLRGLLGQGGPPMGAFGGLGGNAPFGGVGRGGGRGERGPAGGRGQGGRGPGIGAPGVPGGGPGAGDAPGFGGPQGQPFEPGAGPQGPGQPGFPPGQPQGQPFPDGGFGGNVPGRPGRRPGYLPGGQNRPQPGQPPQAGGFGGNGFPGNGFGGFPPGFGGPRASLVELIELMEQKLAAMKK